MHTSSLGLVMCDSVSQSARRVVLFLRERGVASLPHKAARLSCAKQRHEGSFRAAGLSFLWAKAT